MTCRPAAAGTVGLLDGVDDGVDEATGVRVGVADITEVGVGLGAMAVVVFTEVAMDVLVAACVLELFKLSINWGAFAPDSRAERLMAVEPGVDTLKLKVPWVFTNDDTSSVTQLPDVTAGEAC